MTVNKRIREARQALGMNQAEFAQAIFISNGYVAELECEHRKANDRIVHLISMTFGISEKWLKEGEGEMFYKTPPEKIQRMTRLFTALSPKFQDYAMQQLEHLVAVTKEKE
jgi:transcriptional regulator with XRE-family HTH domain